jgi:glutathione S-transferase
MAALSRDIRISEEFVDLAIPDRLLSFNPLGQIPTLILDDGCSLFDSQTIMLYLDECHAGPRLFPWDRRAHVLTQMSLCDGVMEATLQRRLERLRPPEQQSMTLMRKLEQRIGRGLAAMDEFSLTHIHEPTLLATDIAVLAALGYVDFRYTREWRSDCPHLTQWYAANAARSLALATAPTRTAPVAAG